MEYLIHASPSQISGSQTIANSSQSLTESFAPAFNHAFTHCAFTRFNFEQEHRTKTVAKHKSTLRFRSANISCLILKNIFVEEMATMSRYGFKRASRNTKSFIHGCGRPYGTTFGYASLYFGTTRRYDVGTRSNELKI